MALKSEDLLTFLKESFPDASIELEDFRGDEDHYSLKISSASFKGKSRIEQHKMVYKALKGAMGYALHALTLTTQAK